MTELKISYFVLGRETSQMSEKTDETTSFDNVAANRHLESAFIKIVHSHARKYTNYYVNLLSMNMKIAPSAVLSLGQPKY